MNILEESFTINFERHLIKGDVFRPEKCATTLVMLHGAGMGTRDRYRDFRTRLAQRSLGSVAFDFVGFGETGGDVGESSLQSRTEQACAVIKALGLNPPLRLFGASMGGYTAVKLLEFYPVESAILFVPAMYDIAAYSVPFGEEFSKIIRKPESWVASDAWKILQKFRGRLLVVAAGQDNIIPHDVIRRIAEAAANTAEREIYTVRQSPHLLIHYLSQDERECGQVVELVQHYLT
ncbi:MAG: alpha/beta fold hydrolase [Anaerolineae bacterium]|nr:alpha/beta fold hydrolase [Anaerolineae bacterium]